MEMKRIRFEWGRRNTARLIKLFQEQEVLWDKTNIYYHNKTAREIAYSSILNDLQDVLPDDATTHDLRCKINSIRVGHLKSKANKDKPYFTKPWFYDMLYFLRGEPKPESSRKGTGTKDPIEILDEKKDSKWKDETVVIKMLKLYKEHPVLWNPNDEHYKNRVKRKQAHKIIAQQLSRKDITASDVYKKIWELRKSYNRLLNRTREEEEEEEQEEYAVPYWFESMNFLQNINSDNASVNSHQMESSQTYCSYSEDEYNLEDVCEEDCEEVGTNNENLKKLEEKTITSQKGNMEHENVVEMPETSNRKSLNTQIDNNMSKGMAIRQVVDVNTLAEQKFHWIVKEMICTMNRLHDEETIYDLINFMQKLLKEAESSDKMFFRPEHILKEFQKRKTLDSEKSVEDSCDPLDAKEEKVFEVKLTFKAQADAHHIFKAISQLPNLEYIQLTGNNFHTAITAQTDKL